VKSGNETTYHGSIYLLGGRAYALRLEFSKAKQGVNDSDKQKQAPPSKPAMVRLKWKPPGGVVETIPARLLSTSRFPEVFVLKTQFPPDDRSMGYERGTSISKEWEQATTDAAIEVAAYVDANLNALAITSDGDGDRAQKLKQFCSTFVERAFRRPLNDEQRVFFVDRQFERAGDPREAVKRVVLLSLQSPRRLCGGGPAGAGAVGFAARSRLVERRRFGPTQIAREP
jgi:hypothetical protein